MDLSRRVSRLWKLAPAAAGLLAAGLGFLLLGRKALSTDEAFAVAIARRPLADLLDAAVEARLDQVAHLLVLHPVARVNDAEWAVRTPSVLAAALSAGLLYVVGARLFGRLGGAVAALGLALNAGFVSAAQLAQPYTLAVLGIVASTLLFLLVLEGESTGWTVPYVLSAAALPLLHPAAAAVLAAHVAAAVFHDRRAWLPIVATVAALTLTAPLLAIAAVERHEEADAAVLELGELAEGIARATGWNPVLLGLAGLGVAAGGVRLREAATWKAILVGGLAVAPLLGLLLASLALPVFPDHALVLAAPGLALASGAAVAGLSDRQRLGAVGALAAVAALAVAAQYWVGPEEDWRRAARAVRLVLKPPETVVVLPERARPAFAYYAPELATSMVARGAAAWVVVQADTPVEAIELGRTAVTTPRYALRRQFRYGDGLRLQHWIRP